MDRPILETTQSVAVSWLLLLAVFTLEMLAAAEPNDWPKAPGPVFALRNAHFSSPKVTLDARGQDIMAFDYIARGRALFGRNYELVCDGGSFIAKDAGAWVGKEVAKSKAFTVEFVISPAEMEPGTKGTVFAYCNASGEDFGIYQDKDGLSWRMGEISPITLFKPDSMKPVHLLITCDKNIWSAHRDGQPVRSGTVPAELAAWEKRDLVFGASWNGSGLWRGRIESIAIFARALSTSEIAAEASAAKVLLADRKPSTSIRFEGTLLRQAKTSELKEISPYTRSLTVAEYKVDKVLAGEWKQPTITVLHWTIMDARRLSIADRKPGAAVVLRVDRIEDHPQLESCRRDELDGDISADLFYCEIENP